MSKEIATIYRDVPLNISFDDIKYKEVSEEKLSEIFEDLEFYSLLKNFKKKEVSNNVEYIEVNSLSQVILEDEVSIYLELSEENYHKADIIGIGLSDKNHNYYLDALYFKDIPNILKDKVVYTYHAKALNILLKRNNLEAININYDLMISSYLLNGFTKDDIAYLLLPEGVHVEFYEENLKNHFENQIYF